MARRRDGGRIGATAATVAVVLISTLLLPSLQAAHPESAFQVSVTATPSAGDAPLLVTLSEVVSSGTPSSVNWSFGDGTYLNGSGSGALAPEHTFPSPGTFTVHAEVWEGALASNGSTSVTVRPSPIRIAIAASPLSGRVPLAVTFVATVTGGGGPTGPVNWTFGDDGAATGGTVTHVFATAGLYLVRATASDTNGSLGNASLFIDALSNGTVSEENSPGLYLEYGIAAGLAVAIMAAVLVVRRGRRPMPSPPAGIYGGFDEEAPAPEPAASTDGAPGGGPADEGARAQGPSTLTGDPTPRVGAPPSGPPPTSSGSEPRPDPRRVTREVVDFLYHLGRISPDDIPTTEWTQQGMGERLAIPQNALSNVLRRLEAAGIVTTRVEHVHGRPRRVKTYYLTPTGERLARSRRRGPVSGGSSDRPHQP